MVPSPVLVGVPTFRRPDRLATLLDALRADLAGSRRAAAGAVRVLVADNAADPATRDVVAAHHPGVPVDVVDVHVRGYSAVRNALVEGLLADADAQWLVMLDDDATVRSPWLDTLIDTAEAHDADLVGGPVVGDLPADSSRLARNSLFAGRARHATGPVRSLNGNCNVGVRRRLVERLGTPVFDLALGSCGGEDYEFFRHARRVGARIVWCDEAVVVEPTPTERLRASALLGRVRNSNRVGAHVDMAYDGTAATAMTTLRHAWWTVKTLGAGVLRAQPDRFYEATLKGAGVLGRAEAAVERLRGRGPRLVRAARR